MDLDHFSSVVTGMWVVSYQVAGLSSTPTKVKLRATQGASFERIMDWDPSIARHGECSADF